MQFYLSFENPFLFKKLIKKSPTWEIPKYPIQTPIIIPSPVWYKSVKWFFANNESATAENEHKMASRSLLLIVGGCPM
jgi:hypothetical protein